MKFSVVGLVALILGMVNIQAMAAWNLGEWQLGANGHYYSVQKITGPTTGWLIARTQAQALVAPNGSPVDLATLTSSTENAFVASGVDDAGYWRTDPAGGNEGPNIGGFQSDKLAEPAGHWAWVTGEPFVFTQWSANEPNNQSGIEDFLTFYGLGTNRTSNWNDISSNTSNTGAVGGIDFYVAEATAVPEPGSMLLLGIGATALLMRRRQRGAASAT